VQSENLVSAVVAAAQGPALREPRIDGTSSRRASRGSGGPDQKSHKQLSEREFRSPSCKLA